MSAFQVSISDCKEIISRKLLINKMSIEVLKHQNEFSDLSISLQEYSKKVANKKIELVKELDRVYESQLSDFTKEGNDLSLELARQINMLDRPTDEYISIIKLLEAKENEMLNLLSKIEYLNKLIPDQKEIEKFVVKFSDKNCADSANLLPESTQLPDPDF
jgi:hypothetical protein